jgi:hypothetical protein
MGGSKIVKFKKVCSKPETVIPPVCTLSESNSTFDTHNLEKRALYKKVCNKMPTTA